MVVALPAVLSALVDSRLPLLIVRAARTLVRLCQAVFGNVPELDTGDCDERVAQADGRSDGRARVGPPHTQRFGCFSSFLAHEHQHIVARPHPARGHIEQLRANLGDSMERCGYGVLFNKANVARFNVYQFKPATLRSYTH